MTTQLQTTQLLTIASNPNYEILVSKSKNRAYLKIIGFWRSPQQVPDYIADWEKAVKELKSGFTLLTDVREMKIAPASVREMHTKTQSIVVKAGVKKVAEVQSDKVTELQLDGLAQDTQMPKRNFNHIEEAEAWLDS